MSVAPIADVAPAVLSDTDADRLSALFDAHYDRLYSVARRLAATRDEALDLVQETFLRTARSAASVPRGARDEEAWLVRVLVNLQRDEWRKADVRRRHAAEAAVTVRPTADVEDAAVACATVWSALGALTPRRRAVVVLHELEGVPVPRIAQLLGIAGVTVRWHLSRGRAELARVLGADRGGCHEDR